MSDIGGDLLKPRIINVEGPDILNPYSNAEAERRNWLNSVQIPIVDRNDQRLRLIGETGSGVVGKVFKAELDDKPVAIKFIKHITPGGKILDVKSRLLHIKRSFCGLLLAHDISPDNFPKPIAQFNYRGQPSGLIMDFVEGTSLLDDIDVEATMEKQKATQQEVCVYKPNRKPSIAFFDELRCVLGKLHGKNLSCGEELNAGAIIRNKEEKPILVDISYGIIPPVQYYFDEEMDRLNKFEKGD